MSVGVSVIIPTFNRAALIGETLDSILAQTAPPAEVIVVDDGSTDQTEAAVTRYGPRVRYHRVASGETANIGPSSARNVGVSLAACPWIAFCDSDDLWLPRKLERQLRLHALRPDLECSITDFAHAAGGARDLPSFLATAPAGYWNEGRRVLEESFWIFERSLYERVLRFQPSRASTLLISKRRFESLGGFSDRFSRGLSEDLEFTLRNLGEPPVGVVAEVLVCLRRHAGNRSSDPLRNLRDQVRILEYALATHPAARSCAAVVIEQIRERGVYAVREAFAEGRLDLVRDLAPSLRGRNCDWKTAIKIAVISLPIPLARLLQRSLVTMNAYLAKST